MNKLSQHRSGRASAFASRQRGASLLFALITLVALALAASALVRSVDTGAVVMGNLGAKKATAIAADRATQQAIKFLFSDMTESMRLQDQANSGYYATSKEDYNMSGYGDPDPAHLKVNWEIDGSCVAADSCDPLTRASDSQTIDATARIEARWLITRLCGTAGIDAKGTSGNNCAVAPKASNMKNQSTGAIDQSSGRNFELQNQQPFYRIVVRVKGPRNAVTYTETIVNLSS